MLWDFVWNQYVNQVDLLLFWQETYVIFYFLFVYTFKEFSKIYTNCAFFKVDVDVNSVCYETIWYIAYHFLYNRR